LPENLTLWLSAKKWREELENEAFSKSYYGILRMLAESQTVF